MTIHRYAGRTALVTGAAQGIGAAIAARLAHEGAAVAVTDVNLAGAQASAEAIVADGGTAVALAVDVSSEASVVAGIDEAAKRLGVLDIVVNNAGITRDNLIFRMSADEFDAVLSTHLRGTFLVIKAAQRHMVVRHYGRIVNLSSRSALGNRGQANYAAAKAGIIGLTATSALELGRFGITVNAVAPGFIDTAMTAATARRLGLEPEEFIRQSAAQVAVGRVGVPDDVAAAVAFLASEEAGYVSGQLLFVNGGPC